MAKFGLFKIYQQNPTAEYQGDTMQMEKEFVKIYVNNPVNEGELPTRELVAAIRLDKGFDVRKILD
jgi:hypothetical protein